MATEAQIQEVRQNLDAARAQGDVQAVLKYQSLLSQIKQNSNFYMAPNRGASEIAQSFASGVASSARENFQRMRELPQEQIALTNQLVSGSPQERIAAAKQLGPSKFGLYALAESGVPFLSDFIVESAKAIGNTISTVTPDTLEEPVVRSFLEGAESFLSNPRVQSAIEAAKNGMEAYNQWKNASPVNSAIGRNLEAVVDVSLLAAPSVPVVSGTIKKTGSIVRNVGSRLEQRALSKIAERESSEVAKLLQPFSINQFGNLEETGLLRTRTWNPDNVGREIIEAVESVPAVNTNRSALYNYNTIRDEIAESSRDITQGIRNAAVDGEIPRVNMRSLRQRIDDEVSSMVDNNHFYRGDLGKEAEKMRDYVFSLFDEMDDDALSVFRARQRLDEYLKTVNPDILQANGNILKQTRDRLAAIINSEVARVVPDTDVSSALHRISRLYDANMLLYSKASNEGANVIQRLHQTLREGGVNLPYTPLALAATGTASYYALNNMSPYLATGLATLLGVGAATSIIRSPQTMRYLGGLLNATGKVIEKGTAPASVLEQLRADRLVLIDLMQNMRDSSETPSPRPPLRAE